MNQYLLTISMDGNEAVPCLPVGENALGLNCKGITWQDQAVVSIHCNAKNELSVRAEGDMPVILERSGRRLSLKSREIRLLSKDIIFFDGHRFEIESMHRCGEQKRRFSSRQAMLSAAAFAIMTIPACQPKNDGYPETPPQVENRLTGVIAEPPDISIIPGKTLTSIEGESAAELFVMSDTVPSDSLHIEISADKPDQVVISPNTYDGFPKNHDWFSDPETRRIEVRCIDDGIQEEQTEVKIRFKVSSNDPDYNNLEAERSIFCVDKPAAQAEPIEPEIIEPRLTGDVVKVSPEPPENE